MKPTINSEKHYVHFPVFTVTNGARTATFVLRTDNALGNAFDVRVGAVVKAIYLEVWVEGATVSTTVEVAFVKLPSGAAGPTFTDMANMGAYVNKKNVLEYHEGLMPTGGNIIPLFRGWVMIPKGKQRMGLGDDFVFTVAAVGADASVCGFATFKEYF